LDVIYSLLVGGNHLLAFNAILLLVVVILAKSRLQEIVDEVKITSKRVREHEMTFVKHDLEIVREDNYD